MRRRRVGGGEGERGGERADKERSGQAGKKQVLQQSKDWQEQHQEGAGQE